MEMDGPGESRRGPMCECGEEGFRHFLHVKHVGNGTSGHFWRRTK